MLPPWWSAECREEPLEMTSDVVRGATEDRVVELPDGVLALVMSTLPELDVFSEQCAPKEHDEKRCPACETQTERGRNILAQELVGHQVRNDYGLGWPRAAANTARYVNRNGTGGGAPGDDLELWPEALMWPVDLHLTTPHNRGALRRIAMVMAALHDRQGVGDGVRTARRRTRRQHDRRSIAGDIAARRGR